MKEGSDKVYNGGKWRESYCKVSYIWNTSEHLCTILYKVWNRGHTHYV